MHFFCWEKKVKNGEDINIHGGLCSALACAGVQRRFATAIWSCVVVPKATQILPLLDYQSAK